MRDLLLPLLNLATGLGGLVFLFAALRAGARRAEVWVRLQLLGLLAVPVGFQLMAQGVANGTLGSAADMLVFGAVVMFAATLLFAAALTLAPRPAE